MLLIPLVGRLRSSSAGAFAALDGDSYHELTFAVTRNYDHVASLWQHEGWIPQSAVDLARAHYAAYMVRRQDGLRVITLNTDLCE